MSSQAELAAALLPACSLLGQMSHGAELTSPSEIQGMLVSQWLGTHQQRFLLLGYRRYQSQDVASKSSE